MVISSIDNRVTNHFVKLKTCQCSFHQLIKFKCCQSATRDLFSDFTHPFKLPVTSRYLSISCVWCTFSLKYSLPWLKVDAKQFYDMTMPWQATYVKYRIVGFYSKTFMLPKMTYCISRKFDWRKYWRFGRYKHLAN